MSETESYPKAEFFRNPNLSEHLPNVRKCRLNTRHDNREVTLIHLAREQTLRSDKCATGPIHTERVNDYQCYSLLTVLPLRSMSCISSTAQIEISTIYDSVGNWTRKSKNFVCSAAITDSRCSKCNMLIFYSSCT